MSEEHGASTSGPVYEIGDESFLTDENDLFFKLVPPQDDFNMKNGWSLTHYQSKFISDKDVFIVSKFKIDEVVTSETLKNRLGFCVKLKNKECMNRLGCKPCSVCKVCCCIYQCDCFYKFHNTLWCPHIHVAGRRKLHLYGEGAYMFVHNSLKHTEMNHIKAFIRGPAKMVKENEARYREEFHLLIQNRAHYVTRAGGPHQPDRCSCEQMKICQICQACVCKWKCTCPDYWRHGQTCEHIHNVVMQQRHENGDRNYFEALGEYPANFYNQYEYQLVADASRQHYIALMHNLSHELKMMDESPFDPEREHSFVVSVRQDDGIKFSGKRYTVERVADKGECYCDQPNFKKSNCCPICNICSKHFTCTCHTSNFIMCVHMHFVQRLVTMSVNHELLEERYKDIADRAKKISPNERHFIDRMKKEQNLQIRNPVAGICRPDEDILKKMRLLHIRAPPTVPASPSSSRRPARRPLVSLGGAGSQDLPGPGIRQRRSRSPISLPDESPHRRSRHRGRRGASPRPKHRDSPSPPPPIDPFAAPARRSRSPLSSSSSSRSRSRSRSRSPHRMDVSPPVPRRSSSLSPAAPPRSSSLSPRSGSSPSQSSDESPPPPVPPHRSPSPRPGTSARSR